MPALAFERRRLVVGAGLVVLMVLVAGISLLNGGRQAPDAGGVVVGEPYGQVLASTPAPSEHRAAPATERPVPAVTIAPTVEATPSPPAATPVPATPIPEPSAPPPPTPAPTAVMVAMAAAPDQTVATWYAHVRDARFDAAYAMWTDRMKRDFPRQANLDGRWSDTAEIAVHQLYVAQQTATYATVQIEFTETKENGSTRRFIGWWELVRAGDGWLLDQPHF